MSIQEIEKRIIAEAEVEAAKIKKETGASIHQLEKAQAARNKDIEAEMNKTTQLKAEEIKRSILVPARLKAKRVMLKAKQDVLSEIYKDIQKAKKLSAAELNKLREDSEVRAAEILFGAQK
ncbi:MAG: hypothetical protein KKA31_02885 [Candidatus Margulisbacteria bacterium]|nr:hypothetical protein [Candidatus Margulisiibacteriota bacterium]